jgi:hypothetical protein
MKKQKTLKKNKKDKNNQCSQTFCKKALKKSRERLHKSMKQTRKKILLKQKELKQKIAAAEKKGDKTEIEKLSKEHVQNYLVIEEFEKFLKSGNKANFFEDLHNTVCKKLYCNPGCKDTIISDKFSGDYYDKLPTGFIQDLKKNGATSACIESKPLEDFY